MYDYYLFDLDGTLTDPGIGITNAVMYALDKYGIHVNDRTELYPFIGPPLAEAFSKFYGFSTEQAWEAVGFYREYYRGKGLFENRVYDGITGVLEELKHRGATLAVATSKPEEFTLRILEHFGLQGYFDFVGGATMDGSRGKKADVIAYVMEQMGIRNQDRVLMIGDRFHDVLGAKENGIPCAGVLYGYGSKEELEQSGAAFIVSEPKEIATL